MCNDDRPAAVTPSDQVRADDRLAGEMADLSVVGGEAD